MTKQQGVAALMVLTDDEAREINVRSGFCIDEVSRLDIRRLLSAREADRKEIERLKTAKIEAATMADQAAREELAKEAKEQAIRLAATIAADARLAERARCVQAIKDRVIDSAIRQASIRAIEASDE